MSHPALKRLKMCQCKHVLITTDLGLLLLSATYIRVTKGMVHVMVGETSEPYVLNSTSYKNVSDIMRFGTLIQLIGNYMKVQKRSIRTIM